MILELTIKVGLASCGLAAGAGEVYSAIEKYLKKSKVKTKLKKTACIGLCFVEPLVEISSKNGNTVTYGEVTPEKVTELIEAYAKGKPINKNVILSNILEGSENERLNNQTRIVLRNCGIIDAESIED